MTREWPWVFWWGGASVEASPKVSRGGKASDGASPCKSRGASKGSSRIVELVCGLHQVSSGGNQGEFRDGGASV